MIYYLNNKKKSMQYYSNDFISQSDRFVMNIKNAKYGLPSEVKFGILM